MSNIVLPPAPIRESVAKLVSIIVRYYFEFSATLDGQSVIPNIMNKYIMILFENSNDWNIRYSGYLILKYVLNIIPIASLLPTFFGPSSSRSMDMAGFTSAKNDSSPSNSIVSRLMTIIYKGLSENELYEINVASSLLVFSMVQLFLRSKNDFQIQFNSSSKINFNEFISLRDILRILKAMESPISKLNEIDSQLAVFIRTSKSLVSLISKFYSFYLSLYNKI